MYSDQRKEAMNRNKSEDGFHRCELCKKLTEEVNIDHEPPVVLVTGFDGYSEVFERMFCSSDKLRKLCPPCHSKKSSFEMSERKKYRAINKIKK